MVYFMWLKACRRHLEKRSHSRSHSRFFPGMLKCHLATAGGWATLDLHQHLLVSHRTSINYEALHSKNFFLRRCFLLQPQQQLATHFIRFRFAFLCCSSFFIQSSPSYACVVFFYQVMVTNVTSLLKTVKAVEDEATRGTRALEATIECIKQELAVRHMPI